MATKDLLFLPSLSEKLPYNNLRFDFEGNGQSTGKFSIGGFKSEVDQIKTVVDWARNSGYIPLALIGHSKGANEVLMYSVVHGDVPLTVSIAGRVDMGVLPKVLDPVLDKVETEGQATLSLGSKEFLVEKTGLQERKKLNMNKILSAQKSWVCVIHGENDEITNPQDAFQMKTILGQNCFDFQIVPEADHMFKDVDLAIHIENFFKKSVPLLELMRVI